MSNNKQILIRVSKWYLNSVGDKHPVFDTILVATAVVLFWRGIWGILDLYLFPDNESASFAISTLLGILFLLFHDALTDLKGGRWS